MNAAEVDSGLIARVRERGFAIIPGLLSPGQVGAAAAALQRAAEEDIEAWRGRDYPDAWMVHNLMVRGRPFEDLLENPRLHAHLTPLLGETCILYAYASSTMPPGGANYSSRVHVDSPRVIPGYITNVGVMIALTDYTEHNGATYYLPGSHGRVEPPSVDEFLATAERVLPRAGDAVIFNARTWHMGGRNAGTSPRHAITMNVCRSYMRQRFDYPRLVPSDVVERLGPVGRRFLGFNVRMPVSLEEYHVPDDQRLYKSAQG